MKELIRRVVLAVGLLGGLWLILSPAPELYRVDPQDWEHERARRSAWADDAKRLMAGEVGKEMVQDLDLVPETRGELAAFIADRTEGRLAVVEGPQWEGFFNGIAGTVLGAPPSPEWQARRARSLYSDALYFRPDEPPLAGIAPQLPELGAGKYIQIKADARDEYLFVVRDGRREVFSRAPAFLAFPWRHAGLLLMLAALLLYTFVPWPRIPAEGLYYSRMRAGFLPDLMGVILAGMFFAVPILVPPSFSGDSPFDPGWNIMTTLLWLLALLGLAILAVAAWYMSLTVELTPDGIRYRGMGSESMHRWEDLERVDGYAQPDIPPWLRKALFVMSLANPRALGPALMFSGQQAGLRMLFRDGTSRSLILKTLLGGRAFVERLHARGVPIAAEVFAAVGAKPDGADAPAPFPRASGRVPRLVLLLPALGALGYLVKVTAVPADPRIESGPLRAEPFALPPEPEPTVTWEMLAEESRILDEMRAEQRKMDDIMKRMEQAPADERPALQAEFQAVLERSQELHRQFEALGAKPAQ